MRIYNVKRVGNQYAQINPNEKKKSQNQKKGPSSCSYPYFQLFSTYDRDPD